MDGHRLQYVRGILVGVLLLAVAANAAEFLPIEREVGRTYAAFNTYESADITQIALAHTPTVLERFQLYTEVRRWATGADVLVPTQRVGLQRDQLVGLGGVGDIATWDSDWTLSDDDLDRLQGFIVAEGEDRYAGPFALVLIPESIERLVTVHDGTRLLLVDERLLEGFAP